MKLVPLLMALLLFSTGPVLADIELADVTVPPQGEDDLEDAVDLQAQAMFEALKRGDEQEIAWLKENLSRYEAVQRGFSWSAFLVPSVRYLRASPARRGGCAR